MANSEATEISADIYSQIWSSSDLNPDRLTTELENLFVKNVTETQKRNDSNTYFSLDTNYLEQTADSNSVSASVSGGGFGVSAAVSGSVSSSSSHSLQDQLASSNQNIFSKDDIEKLLAEQHVQIEWKGEKFIPKSFKVYRLTDLTNQLQVAIIAKQLSVDKARGAIIRTINTLNTIRAPIIENNVETSTEAIMPTNPSTEFLTGTIQIYAGNTTPPKPWLFCDGSRISRTEYERLFNIIGETYGAGDGRDTFNLPDLRGRVTVGVDPLEIYGVGLNKLGSVGGQFVHQLTIDQIPAHNHSAGSLSTSSDGNHSHSINDPGHDHGGKTENLGPFGSGRWGMVTKGGSGSDQSSHSHTIPRGQTYITINTDGSHVHMVDSGHTGSVGLGQEFSLMQPYQTVNYIIYAA